VKPETPDLAQRWGENMRQRREELGLSVRDVADAACVSWVWVDECEEGTRTPGYYARRSIVQALGSYEVDIFPEPDVPTEPEPVAGRRLVDDLIAELRAGARRAEMAE